MQSFELRENNSNYLVLGFPPLHMWIGIIVLMSLPQEPVVSSSHSRVVELTHPGCSVGNRIYYERFESSYIHNNAEFMCFQCNQYRIELRRSKSTQ